MDDQPKRTATIRTAEQCRLAYLNKNDFKRILSREATESIYKRYLFIKDYCFLESFTY